MGYIDANALYYNQYFVHKRMSYLEFVCLFMLYFIVYQNCFVVRHSSRYSDSKVLKYTRNIYIYIAVSGTEISTCPVEITLSDEYF